MKTLIIGQNGQVATKVIQNFIAKKVNLKVTTTKKIDESNNLFLNDLVELVKLDLFNFDNHNLFNDVKKVLFVWPGKYINYDPSIEKFIDSMLKSNVKRIVFISAMGIEQVKSSPYTIIQNKLLASSKDVVIVQPNMYMQNILTHHLPVLTKYNDLCMPGKKLPISYIDANDVGDVIFKIMNKNIKCKQKLILTGEQIITVDQILATLNKVWNKDYINSRPNKKNFTKMMQSSTNNSLEITELWSLYFWAKLWTMKKITKDAQNILQRPLHTLEEVIAEQK